MNASLCLAKLRFSRCSLSNRVPGVFRDIHHLVDYEPVPYCDVMFAGRDTAPWPPSSPDTISATRRLRRIGHRWRLQGVTSETPPSHVRQVLGFRPQQSSLWIGHPDGQRIMQRTSTGSSSFMDAGWKSHCCSCQHSMQRLDFTLPTMNSDGNWRSLTHHVRQLVIISGTVCHIHKHIWNMSDLNTNQRCYLQQLSPSSIQQSTPGLVRRAAVCSASILVHAWRCIRTYKYKRSSTLNI